MEENINLLEEFEGPLVISIGDTFKNREERADRLEYIAKSIRRGSWRGAYCKWDVDIAVPNTPRNWWKIWKTKKMKEKFRNI